MGSTSYSIPFGMVFGKHYCHRCGSRLEREHVERTISPSDPDYFEYHDRRVFPRSDHKAYSYIFRCPLCEARISFEEQRIISHIQKKCKRKLLSRADVKANYDGVRKRLKKKDLVSTICWNCILPQILLLPIFYGIDDIAWKAFLFCFLEVVVVLFIIRAVLRYRGIKNRLTPGYTNDELDKCKRLHAYSIHNKKLIEESEVCHCFHCMSTLSPSEIVRFTDFDEAAICPRCGIDSVLPSAADDEIDEETLKLMNEYWF